MNAESILKAKGSTVITTGPETTVAEAMNKMKREKIGALVVSGGGIDVVGIITERDVLHGLAEHGAALLEKRVSEVMIRDVFTAGPEDEVGALMAIMTERRCRHIPVMEEGALCGLISIGDLVKSRLEEMEREASELRDYITRS